MSAEWCSRMRRVVEISLGSLDIARHEASSAVSYPDANQFPPVNTYTSFDDVCDLNTGRNTRQPPQIFSDPYNAPLAVTFYNFICSWLPALAPVCAGLNCAPPGYSAIRCARTWKGYFSFPRMGGEPGEFSWAEKKVYRHWRCCELSNQWRKMVVNMALIPRGIHCNSEQNTSGGYQIVIWSSVYMYLFQSLREMPEVVS